MTEVRRLLEEIRDLCEQSTFADPIEAVEFLMAQVEGTDLESPLRRFKGMIDSGDYEGIDDLRKEALEIADREIDRSDARSGRVINRLFA